MPTRAQRVPSHSAIGGERRRRPIRGQSMVEVALVLPLLVTIIIAGIDLSRYVAMHSAADSASREATRYASAVGPSGESTPRYVNCAGIRAAAEEAAPILDLSAPAAVEIEWEDGDDDSLPAAGLTCPATPPPGDVHRLDKIVVRVTARFQPTISLLQAFDIESMDRRTIVAGP